MKKKTYLCASFSIEKMFPQGGQISQGESTMLLVSYLSAPHSATYEINPSTTLIKPDGPDVCKQTGREQTTLLLFCPFPRQCPLNPSVAQKQMLAQ